MSTDHQANVLGNAGAEVNKCWTLARQSGEGEDLRPVLQTTCITHVAYHPSTTHVTMYHHQLPPSSWNVDLH